MTDEVSASGKQCSLVNFISHFNDNISCMFYLTRVIDFELRYINNLFSYILYRYLFIQCPIFTVDMKMIKENDNTRPN